MRTKSFSLLALLFLLPVLVVSAANEEKLALDAISVDSSVSGVAIRTLRDKGQKGLNILFETYSKDIENYSDSGTVPENWKRISKAIDKVAMQKDAYSSRLYWYTDFDQAKAFASKTNKPILSLRLLGGLDEEYSCANSRFFRSILYSDKSISEYLRNNYVLHWKTVRPAPKITIDFGDGRKIVRTITGNSIHYLLDSDGRILDALPGLYNQREFLNYLKNTSRFRKSARKLKGLWNVYRANGRSALIANWRNDIARIGRKDGNAGIELPRPELPLKPAANGAIESNRNPTTLEAAPLAVTKSVVEMPTVRSISLRLESLKKSTDFDDWRQIARLRTNSSISDSSKSFIANKIGVGQQRNGEFSALISNLEKYVAIDTIQNEYLFHTKIYEWLNDPLVMDVDEFNERVFSDLFLTPRSDRWLGLYAPDIYSAIKNNGLVK